MSCGGEVALDLDHDVVRHAAGDRGEDRAEPGHQADPGPQLVRYGTDRLHVDRVGHEIAAQRELHRAGDRGAGLVLGLRRWTRRGAG